MILPVIPPAGRRSSAPGLAPVALRAGLLAGTLDILAAIVVFGWLRGKATPLQILQSVASGVWGPAAYEGGWTTGLAGLGLHFLIALLWAGLFVAAARAWPALRRHWVLSGVLYGAVVWALMNLVVVPLSQVPPRLLTPVGIVLNLSILVLMIGLPIACTAFRPCELLNTPAVCPAPARSPAPSRPATPAPRPTPKSAR
ncbi:hypothetical protein [Hymenobacter jeollabukensis]|uniref:DUF1440 domain-containing protein n=1 Tax=Hymenobacter jeollabukensis TaxID=2025313 RepID=A0A5R8WWX6_9BACT|nr:hypothetical protein [Hymenobacter jeollabukensis]TLM97021.1 hypothetical protein FDY95_03260 [Hymenobacter jeollabukensis]